VCPCIPQCQRHVFGFAVHKKRSDRFYGTEPHARRRSGSEYTEDELFPESFVRPSAPNVMKLIEPRANLFPARLVRGTYVFNNYRLAVRSHWIVNTQILGLRFRRCQRNWTSYLWRMKACNVNRLATSRAQMMASKDSLPHDCLSSCYYSSGASPGATNKGSRYAKQRQSFKYSS
jgi:hypothetical protein